MTTVLNEAYKSKLLERIQISDHPSGCWIWTGYKHKGYGVVRIDNRRAFVHRLMWHFHSGDDLYGDYVIRHVVCRNTACCNPAHLATGTDYDNAQDRERDRIADIAAGLDVSRGDLTANQVRDIRKRIIFGNRWHVGNIEELAATYDVSNQVILDAATGRTWRTLTDVSPVTASSATAVNRVLSLLQNQTLSIAEIAESLGLPLKITTNAVKTLRHDRKIASFGKGWDWKYGIRKDTWNGWEKRNG